MKKRVKASGALSQKQLEGARGGQLKPYMWRDDQISPKLTDGELASVTGGVESWKLGNKEWSDDWLAPK